MFCSRPLARDQFTQPLKRSEFDVVAIEELQLPAVAVEALDTPCLAVIDASNVIAPLNLFVRFAANSASCTCKVLLPSLDDSVTFPPLRLGVKGLLAYPLAQRKLCRAAHRVSGGGYWVPRELLTAFVESILPELRGCKSLDTEAGISHKTT